MAKKILKYTSISLFALFVILGIVGKLLMDNHKKSPEFIIAQMSMEQCPIVLGGGIGEISELTYEDGYLVYNACLRDQYIDIESTREHVSNFEEIIGVMFYHINGINSQGSKEVMDFLEEHQLGIKFAIRNDSGDTCSLACSFEEVKKSYDSFENLSPTDALCKGLEYNIETYNEELPMQIDEWMWLESFTVEGDTLFMNIKVDGEGYDVREMDFSGVTILDIEMTDDEKTLYEVFLGMCKTANCHFAMKYFDKDTHEEAIMFTDKNIIKQINTHSYIDKF